MSNKAKTATMKNDGKSALTPKLRFPDFQNAGEWENKPLSACLDYHQPTPYLVSDTNYNPAFKTPVLTAGKTFILGYTSEQHGIFSEDLPVIIFDDFTTASQFVDFPFKAKSSAMKILQAKNGANIKFMYETLQMLSYEVGVHERHWISNFAPMLVSVPKPPEQQKIADCLTSVDELIAAQARKVDALKTHKKGLMQQLFPREGETRPRLRFPEFQGAGEWEEKKLSEMIELISGIHLSPDDYSTTGEVPYFTGPSDFTNELSNVTKWSRRTANVSQAEDTLITVKGSGVGEIWFSTLPEVAMGRQLMAIRTKRGPSRFIFQFLLTKRSRFEDLGSGNLIPGLSRAVILDLEACFPSPPEQKRIADSLTSLDDLIAAEGQKLGVLKTHKKGLMQQLFPSMEDA